MSFPRKIPKEDWQLADFDPRLNVEVAREYRELAAFSVDPGSVALKLLGDGQTRTAYLDISDGLCRSAEDSLVAYSKDSSCAEILLELIPIYIAEALDLERLAELSAEGIDSIYCDNQRILYTQKDLQLTELYSWENMFFRTELIP